MYYQLPSTLLILLVTYVDEIDVGVAVVMVIGSRANLWFLLGSQEWHAAPLPPLRGPPRTLCIDHGEAGRCRICLMRLL